MPVNSLSGNTQFFLKIVEEIGRLSHGALFSKQSRGTNYFYDTFANVVNADPIRFSSVIDASSNAANRFICVDRVMRRLYRRFEPRCWLLSLERLIKGEIDNVR
ncbi:hypothetical protein KPH14_009392 [Odynerus spinipes]|uniref:Uncharacterized protein n=1 Tax=Odynerus spinipes TaxID=1348599 RepID=A0AAD9RPQ3_9HYME|nr:hypothetical protein KPH14_009392 [Odynerus spinipes]